MNSYVITGLFASFHWSAKFSDAQLQARPRDPHYKLLDAVFHLSCCELSQLSLR